MKIWDKWEAKSNGDHVEIQSFCKDLAAWMESTWNGDDSAEYWDFMTKCADRMIKKHPLQKNKILLGIIIGYLEGTSAEQTGNDLHWSIEEKLHSTVTNGKSGGGREEA